jgi:hypothetical protein
MKAYQLSQLYQFLEGSVVRMYFIQGIPYTFDELPLIIQDHPTVQTQALEGKDWDMEDLYKLSSYLMEEELHPLVFDLQVNDKTLLPQDD